LYAPKTTTAQTGLTGEKAAGTLQRLVFVSIVALTALAKKVNVASFPTTVIVFIITFEAVKAEQILVNSPVVIR
jgi:hypothetical protein